MTDARTLALGITGTDTGIGKTVVACAMAARAVQLGVLVSVMKPVESGVAVGVGVGAERSDADRLRDAAQSALPMSAVRPYVLAEALAPMVAAQRAGIAIEPGVLDIAFATVCGGQQLVLVEGAGGLLVPLSRSMSYLDLFARWRCALVIVAGNRLGVLNHVLLTVRAAEAARVPVRAIVLSSFSSADATVAEATNYDALMSLLPQHTILRFPWVDRIDDASALAAAAAGCGLDALLVNDVSSVGAALPAPPFPE